MTPERWQRITELFHLARGRDGIARAALLDDLCADDLAMRADVEALLTAESKAGVFGDTPVFTAEHPSVALEPGTRLGPYRIDALVGTGGMGAVYRAHDGRLDRDVAIKVLSTTPLDDAARTRLLREARAAAALTHPHVCTVHEVGEADGHAYIAMELIEGTRLDELIQAGGLPVDDLFRYALQIADAIAYAHERGIVHRDLKPANVMISQFGVAKVLDFGLAKVLPLAGQGDGPFTATQTAAGVVAGTAGYMAPEQVLGRGIDERTDIFSFGVLLYELATGRPAFSGATPIEVLAAVLHEQPQPVATVRPDLPTGLSEVIDKAFRKDPSQRYRRIMELTDDLRRLQASGGAVPAVARRRGQLRGTLTVTGIAGAIAVVIAISWTGVPAFRERSDAAFSSPVSAIRRPSGVPERNSLPAYRAVTEARGLYDANRWEAALEAAKRAADLDPEYAEAWAMLGKVYARVASPAGFPGGSLEDYRANAMTAARRAVELDSSSYEGLVALALAHRNLEQIELSRAAARKAIALGPQFPEAYRVLGDTYAETTAWGCAHDRDNALAISLFRQAHSVAATNEGPALINLLKYDKRFDEALRNADEWLRQDPTSRGIRRPRAWILLEMGRLDEAERMLQEAARDGGIRPQDRLYLAGIELKRGHLEAAAEGFRNLGLRARGHVEVARQYTEAKLPGPALVHLEQGIREEPECAGFLLRTNASYWSVIRSVPAARELLEKYNPH